MQLEKLKLGKAAGHDRISPSVQMVCANQLCHIFQHLFNLTLQKKKVPDLRKSSCLVPVEMMTTPSFLNDYRTVTLSHFMKVLERLVLFYISSFLDPMQFTFQPQVSVDNAVSLQQKAQYHLHTTTSSAKITFFDFSSNFSWVLSLCSCQPACLSTCWAAIGAPQRTMLSPFSFTLYTRVVMIQEFQTWH